MPKFMEKLRRTGRTTRMLKRARDLAGEGRAVYVVCDNDRERRRLEIEFGTPKLGVKFETVSMFPEFDWERLKITGAHPNCVVLIDHHAIEDRYARILEELHRYDP